jgi:phosphopantothenoylcysteine decarboxylase/phosphopantothenate--cysteine ligase
LGASVILISGPVALKPPKGITAVQVVSAREMYKAVLKIIPRADIFISAAAVADFKPKRFSKKKIKKQIFGYNIKFEPTVDIIEQIARKRSRPCIVGFSLEDDDLKLFEARRKLKAKKLDFIFANTKRNLNNPLGSYVLMHKGGASSNIPTLPKHAVASKMFAFISRYWN